jgi:UDP-2,3-diacylglucosamine hydrolase
MSITSICLPENKKIYFASDFHLGAPSFEISKAREAKIVKWLDNVKHDASIIFLLGDIFDFWFEYNHAIPKGFIRLQGKLAEISDAGIPIIFFSGNHDMWMFDYFTKELGIEIYHHPLSYKINNHTFHIGHGDGLGPGDRTFKILKKIFRNKVCQWAFNWLHPNIGIGIANTWSMGSKKRSLKKDESFQGEKEWIYAYCKQVEATTHHDYYIFGHRHLPLNMQLSPNSTYFNLGEWMNFYTYGVYDGNKFNLLTYENEKIDENYQLDPFIGFHK